MQAKQEKWDLYDQQGRKTGKKQFKQERQFRRGIVCTVLAYGSLTVRRKFS